MSYFKNILDQASFDNLITGSEMARLLSFYDSEDKDSMNGLASKIKDQKIKFSKEGWEVLKALHKNLEGYASQAEDPFPNQMGPETLTYFTYAFDRFGVCDSFVAKYESKEFNVDIGSLSYGSYEFETVPTLSKRAAQLIGLDNNKEAQEDFIGQIVDDVRSVRIDGFTNPLQPFTPPSWSNDYSLEPININFVTIDDIREEIAKAGDQANSLAQIYSTLLNGNADSITVNMPVEKDGKKLLLTFVTVLVDRAPIKIEGISNVNPLTLLPSVEGLRLIVSGLLAHELIGHQGYLMNTPSNPFTQKTSSSGSLYTPSTDNEELYANSAGLASLQFWYTQETDQTTQAILQNSINATQEHVNMLKQ